MLLGFIGQQLYGKSRESVSCHKRPAGSCRVALEKEMAIKGPRAPYLPSLPQPSPDHSFPCFLDLLSPCLPLPHSIESFLQRPLPLAPTPEALLPHRSQFRDWASQASKHRKMMPQNEPGKLFLHSGGLRAAGHRERGSLSR